MANNSNINYDVDMLRFFIKDEKKSKRTALQEVEIQPLYVHGDTSTIRGNAKNIIVFALPKFTISDKKYFINSIDGEKWGEEFTPVYTQQNDYKG